MKTQQFQAVCNNPLCIRHLPLFGFIGKIRITLGNPSLRNDNCSGYKVLLQCLLLILADGDEQGEPTPPFIFAAFLLYHKASKPFLALPEVIELFDREEPDNFGEVVMSFSIACTLERFRRLGIYKDYQINDPFDPNCGVMVELTDEKLELRNPALPQEEIEQKEGGQRFVQNGITS